MRAKGSSPAGEHTAVLLLEGLGWGWGGWGGREREASCGERVEVCNHGLFERKSMEGDSGCMKHVWELPGIYLQLYSLIMNMSMEEVNFEQLKKSCAITFLWLSFSKMWTFL